MRRYFVILVLIQIFAPLLAKEREMPADSLSKLGTYYYKDQRYVDALDVLGKAMDEADRDGNDRAYLASLMTIGNIYTIFDDYEQALHCYLTSLDKAQKLGSKYDVAKLKNNMLLCYAMLGRYKEAESCYRSIATLDMGDENTNRFYNYLNQALLSKARKYYKGAIYFHTQALRYAQSHGMNGLYVAAEMGQIGTAYEESGDEKEAVRWYLDCLEYSKKGRYAGPLTTSCERLADIYRRQGRDDLFVKYNKLYAKYSDSLFRQKEFNNKRSLVNAYESRMKDRHLNTLQDKNKTLLWVIATIATLMAALVLLLIYIYKVNRRLIATQRLLIKKHQEHSHQLEVQNEIFTSIGTDVEASAAVSHAENVQPAASIAETPADNDAVATGEPSLETPCDASDKVADRTDDTADNAAADEAEDAADGDDLLPKKQADMLLMSIAHVMEDTAEVCNPDFCLSTLAQLVGSNTKYVSWVINKSYGKNFKTYLNEYRIRTASQLLTDTDKFGNLTIAGIAERVGYKSPASFHQAFKKIYAMTPAAYVKLAKNKANY